MRKYSLHIAGFILGIFALLTFYLSSTVILDLFGMRAKQGDYVPIVIGANFIASLLYFGAVYGFIKRRKWTTHILELALLAIIVGGIGLFFHIQSGGAYEVKTPKALAFRFTVTGLFTLLSYYKISKTNTE
jgi:hypothetical protein